MDLLDIRVLCMCVFFYLKDAGRIKFTEFKDNAKVVNNYNKKIYRNGEKVGNCK